MNKTFLSATQHFLLKFLGLCLGFSAISHAQNYSYQQAEQRLLQTSYVTQASLALQQASQLEAEAIKGLGLPRVDFNVRAIKFHSENDVPLGQFKQNIENQLSQQKNQHLSNLSGIGINNDVIQQINQSADSIIHQGVGQLPDYAHLMLDDEMFRPSISVTMPLYTGGLIQSGKNVANIQQKRSELNHQQQQDLQRLSLIQAYFNVQLQKQLLNSRQKNLQAMQLHVDNAFKMEKKGFLSRGQRMQFEVARNHAQRLYQSTQSHYKTSYFQLHNLLREQTIEQLTTPLFINKLNNFSLETMMASFTEQSPIIKKLQADTELADEKINVHYASQKPKVFAFGQYSIDKQANWLIGIGASYNIFSGLDKNKQIQAAELQKYSTQLITAKTQQEIASIIYKAYHEIKDAQHTHQLLLNNRRAAEENLRIQRLSFQEGMGTLSQVVDAENAIEQIDSEKAVNAYRYILALSTLLHNTGALEEFQHYISQKQTDYINN